MGQEISSRRFSPEDFTRFATRLQNETRQLGRLFRENAFHCDRHVGGFELEAWLVDRHAQPVPENVEFLDRLANPEVVPELSRFNFEINVEPLVLRQGALSKFHHNLEKNWTHCRDVATKSNIDVMTIGIHPALRENQLTLKNMSESQRYRALNKQVLEMRDREPITLDIPGREHLNTTHRNVMLEAATTSFQIHLQVHQEQAVRAYNAAQIVSAPLVAISANSPYVFGSDIWDESRIPVFEQAVDTGEVEPRRVTLGRRYVRGSLFNCFKENLKHYPVLIPSDFDDDGSLPHLRLHNGTIWRWNRPLVGYDTGGRPHLRIENRVIPSGPTIVDMIANAAFFWGLVEALIRQPVAPESRLRFAAMRENFYAAVRESLDCSLVWLDGKKISADQLILRELLPLAKMGLESLEISAKDIKKYLGIIETRATVKQNGAHWQRAWVARHGRDMGQLSAAYLERQQTGKPVHEWTI